MSQKSYLWTTGGAGDGASTYTRADWQRIVKILAAVYYDEGVAPSYLSGFAGTIPGANTFRLGTGAAVVDGKPYDSDASVDVTIPSAVGGGNTRIDRIVLRADWTAQTVRITRIAGTDAASPTAPAVTTSSGSTYDVKLFQVRVNTSGTVTIESDERAWARMDVGGLSANVAGNGLSGGAGSALSVNVDGATLEISSDALRVKDGGITEPKLAVSSVNSTHIIGQAIAASHLWTDIAGNGLGGGGGTPLSVNVDGATLEISSDALRVKDGGVTAAKLAADSVDDTIVGNRVPALTRRQGGSASDWSSQGTTTYTPTAVRMQAGVVNISGGGTFTVTFPVAFSAAPIVVVTMRDDSTFATSLYYVKSVSASGFVATVATIGTSPAYPMTAPVLNWVAIGPE